MIQIRTTEQTLLLPGPCEYEHTPTGRIFEPASVFLPLLLNIKIAVVISCTNYTKVQELYFTHRGH